MSPDEASAALKESYDKEENGMPIWRFDITPEMAKSVASVGQARYLPSAEIREKGSKQHLEFWNRELENSGLPDKPKTMIALDAFIQQHLKDQKEKGYAEVFPKPDPEKIKSYYQRVVRDAPLEVAAEFPPDWAALRRMSQREFDAKFNQSAVNKITEERANSLAETANYLLGNEGYSPAEVAQIITAARKQRVNSTKDADENLVPFVQKITNGNEAVPNEISGATASKIAEYMRQGMSSDDAFVKGVFDGIASAAQVESGKNGWKKYNQTEDRSAAEELNNDLASTNWCTGGSVGTAQSHLSDGDFYVFFKDGNPKIAIRTNEGKVAEIRGRGKGQILESPELHSEAESFLLSGQGPTGGGDYLHDQNFRKAALEIKATGIVPDHALVFFKQDGKYIPQKPKAGGYGQESFEKEYAQILEKAKIRKEKLFNGTVALCSIEIKKEDLPSLVHITEVKGTIHASTIIGELSLPNLKKSGDIRADSAKEISLPQLQTSGDIYADSAENLSFPQLQTSGVINASNAKEISLPQLQTSGVINASNAKEISFPQLQTSGDIYARNAENLSLPNLKKSGDIYADSAENLSFPQLQTSGVIRADSAENLSLPNLKKSGVIYASNAKEISFPQLQTSGDIYADSAENLSLPNLKKSGVIYASNAKEISLPQLQTSGDIYADNAKEISLPQLQTSGDIYADNGTVHAPHVPDSKIHSKNTDFIGQARYMPQGETEFPKFPKGKNSSKDPIKTGEALARETADSQGIPLIQDRETEVDLSAKGMTDEWKKWFGASKLVDETGSPIIFQHVSKINAPEVESLDPKFGADDGGAELNRGSGPNKIYFASRDKAKVLAGSGSEKNIYSGFIRMENPYDGRSYAAAMWEAIGKANKVGPKRWKETSAALDARLKFQGYDGIYDPFSGDAAIFSPDQFKSEDNKRPTSDARMKYLPGASEFTAGHAQIPDYSAMTDENVAKDINARTWYHSTKKVFDTPHRVSPQDLGPHFMPFKPESQPETSLKSATSPAIEQPRKPSGLSGVSLPVQDQKKASRGLSAASLTQKQNK
jgi:hypothetical protein